MPASRAVIHTHYTNDCKKLRSSEGGRLCEGKLYAPPTNLPVHSVQCVTVPGRTMHHAVTPMIHRQRGKRPVRNPPYRTNRNPCSKSILLPHGHGHSRRREGEPIGLWEHSEGLWAFSVAVSQCFFKVSFICSVLHLNLGLREHCKVEQMWILLRVSQHMFPSTLDFDLCSHSACQVNYWLFVLNTGLIYDWRYKHKLPLEFAVLLNLKLTKASARFFFFSGSRKALK